MGEEINQEAKGREEEIEHRSKLFRIHCSIFNIEIIGLQIKTLSKLQHIGIYRHYFLEGLELMIEQIDFLIQELDYE